MIHIFHKWSKWVLHGNLNLKGTKSKVGEVYRRECSVCGKVQLDEKYFI